MNCQTDDVHDPQRVELLFGVTGMAETSDSFIGFPMSCEINEARQVVDREFGGRLRNIPQPLDQHTLHNSLFCYPIRVNTLLLWLKFEVEKHVGHPKREF